MDWPRAVGDTWDGITIFVGDPRYSVGGYIGAGSAITNAGVWPASNRAIYVPFLSPRRVTAMKLSTWNGTAVSGTYDVGILDNAGVKLTSSGAVSQTGTGTVQTQDTADVTLYEGQRYYMALLLSNATGIFEHWTNPAAQLSAAGVLQQAVGASTLPSTATFATVASAYLPLIAVHCRTLV